MSAFQIEGLILSIAEVDSNLLGPILMVLILQRILDKKKKKRAKLQTKDSTALKFCSLRNMGQAKRDIENASWENRQ